MGIDTGGREGSLWVEGAEALQELRGVTERVRVSLPWSSLCPQEGSGHGVSGNQGSGPTDPRVMPKRKEVNVGRGDGEKGHSS